MSDSLNGSKALITGATRGIGYAIALEVGRAGADVAICGRTQESVDHAVKQLQQEAGVSAGKFSGLATDISKWSDVRKLFDFVEKNWAKLDLLVNNAGVGIFRPVADLTPEEWHQVIDLNLSGAYYCCHAALPLLRKSGEAYVINLSSLAGRNPFAGGAAYNASKFGLNGFTEAMMLDHRQENIRVTTIMPGSVATEFGGETNAENDRWKIQPEDIAEVVMGLLRLPARTLVSRVEMRPSRPPVK